MNETIKLLANFDSGEGGIRLPPVWKVEAPVMKLGLLQDWIFLLEKEYNRESKEWREEIAALKKKRKK